MTLEQITKERLESLIVTALEGGSNYWYFIPKKTQDIYQEDQYDRNSHGWDGTPGSIKFANAIHDGRYLAIHDIEDTNDKLGMIHLSSCINALKNMATTYPTAYSRIVLDDYDAEDADVWFQLAVMGEITFG